MIVEHEKLGETRFPPGHGRPASITGLFNAALTSAGQRRWPVSAADPERRRRVGGAAGSPSGAVFWKPADHPGAAARLTCRTAAWCAAQRCWATVRFQATENGKGVAGDDPATPPF